MELTRPGDTTGDSPVTVQQSATAGAGDVVGPASSVLNQFALYANTTGKLLKASTDILDSNGNELAIFSATASAVNHISIQNAATGSGPFIKGIGDEEHVKLSLSGKGTGTVGITRPEISASDWAAANHTHESVATGGLLNAKLRTRTGILYIENPTATDEFPLCHIPDAATMIRVIGVTDVGTVDFNIEKRGQLTPDNAGTNIWTVDKQATAAGLNQTSFDSGAVSADNWLHYSASAVASSPTKLWLAWEATID